MPSLRGERSDPPRSGCERVLERIIPMKDMLVAIDEKGGTAKVTITRVIRIEVTEDRQCWFDLALSTELKAYVRQAGARDEEPWRDFAVVPFGASCKVVEVTLAREGYPAVGPSPQAVIDRLAIEARRAGELARRERMGVDAARDTEADRRERQDARTGAPKGPCKWCGKWKRWMLDRDGNVVLASSNRSLSGVEARGLAATPGSQEPCQASAAGGLPCTRAGLWANEACRWCGEPRSWRLDHEGNMVLVKRATCIAPEANGGECQHPDSWIQSTMPGVGDPSPQGNDGGMHGDGG